MLAPVEGIWWLRGSIRFPSSTDFEAEVPPNQQLWNESGRAEFPTYIHPLRLPRLDAGRAGIFNFLRRPFDVVRIAGDKSMDRRTLRVGIVGVGNCASSFVQGLSYYRDAHSNEPIPGLMNVDVGGYGIADISVSSAFDVSAAKVGRDVADAIRASPNNTGLSAEAHWMASENMSATISKSRTNRLPM